MAQSVINGSGWVLLTRNTRCSLQTDRAQSVINGGGWVLLTRAMQQVVCQNGEAAPLSSRHSMQTKPCLAPMSCRADCAPASASAAADVERQLAALSSKLGQLTLCLESMQQQQQAVSVAETAAEETDIRQVWFPGGLGQLWCKAGQLFSVHWQVAVL